MGTQATKTGEATLDTRTKRRYALLQTALIKKGINSRAKLEDIIDQRHSYEALDGIGPILSELIGKALQLSDAAWAVVMPRIATGGTEKPVEAAVVSDVPYTWYPSDMLTEGHSLSVPDEA